MNEFENLRDIFETAEILTAEYDDKLEIEVFNESTDKYNLVTFIFNSDFELVNVLAEDK